MTVIKDLTLPNFPLASYDEVPGQGDTAVVEGWTGESFRNARRTAQPRRFKITLGPIFLSSAEYTAYRAVIDAVQGRLYGFKFVSWVDGATLDVAFLADSYPMTVFPGGDAPTNTLVQCSLEFEEVINGIPE